MVNFKFLLVNNSISILILMKCSFFVQFIVAISNTESYQNVNFTLDIITDGHPWSSSLPSNDHPNWFNYFYNFSEIPKYAEEYFQEHEIEVTNLEGASGIWTSFSVQDFEEDYGFPFIKFNLKSSSIMYSNLDYFELKYCIQGSQSSIGIFIDEKEVKELFQGEEKEEEFPTWKNFDLEIPSNPDTNIMIELRTPQKITGEFIIIDYAIVHGQIKEEYLSTTIGPTTTTTTEDPSKPTDEIDPPTISTQPSKSTTEANNHSSSIYLFDKVLLTFSLFVVKIVLGMKQ